MKKTLRILGIVYCLAGICSVCLFSGCCTGYVSQIGTSRAVFVGKTASCAPDGNIVIEAILERRLLNDYHGEPEQLGRRFIVMNKASRKTFSGLHGQHDGKNVIQIDVRCEQFISEPEEAKHCQSWYLFPADILTPQDPSQAESSWNPSLLTTTHYRSELCYLPWHDGDEEIYLDLRLGQALWGHPDIEYTSPWLKPVKILIGIPAVAIDVVTFPAQFVWFWTHYFDV